MTAGPLTPTSHQPGRAQRGTVSGGLVRTPVWGQTKPGATRTHQHATWWPNVVRCKVACGSLLSARMRLIREQEKHARCFRISGGQPIETRLLACLTAITYSEGLCVYTHSHVLMKTCLHQMEPVDSMEGKDTAKLLFSNPQTLLHHLKKCILL